MSPIYWSGARTSHGNKISQLSQPEMENDGLRYRCSSFLSSLPLLSPSPSPSPRLLWAWYGQILSGHVEAVHYPTPFNIERANQQTQANRWRIYFTLLHHQHYRKGEEVMVYGSYPENMKTAKVHHVPTTTTAKAIGWDGKLFFFAAKREKMDRVEMEKLWFDVFHNKQLAPSWSGCLSRLRRQDQSSNEAKDGERRRCYKDPSLYFAWNHCQRQSILLQSI